MESRLVSPLTDTFAALQEDIVNAMALTGQILMGQAVMVKSSEVSVLLCTFVSFLGGKHSIVMSMTFPRALSNMQGFATWQAEKNLAWEAAQAQNASMLQMSSIANAGSGPCKLQVSNLHPNIQVC